MDMNVALKITAGVSGQQAVDQLRTSMDRMKDTVDGVSNRFGALKGAMAGLAGAAVVTGFVSMMKGIIDTADHLNDLRQKTGMAVEDLDALGYVAELNGSNLEQMAGALGKMAKNMAEAAGGGKEAVAVFRQFGISQRELKDGSISATEAMARIADKIAAMPDGWQKTAAAQKVFGKSAADLVPLLNAGGDAIRNARAELEGMGALFTGGLAAAADQFNDNMTKLKRMGTALGLGIAQEVLPVLNGFVQGLIDAKTNAGNLAGDSSLADWASVAAQGVAVLVDVTRVAAQGILALIGSFQAVWADIQLAGTFLAGGNGLNPFSAENKKILADALAERNATVEQANQRYVTLWKMNGSQTYEAVKSAVEKARSAINTPAAPGKPGGAFDFGAGKETEFDKLKQNLQEQLSKVGELTEAEKLLALLRTDKYKDITSGQRAILLDLAKELDHTKQMADVEKVLAQRRDQMAEQRAQQQNQERKANEDFAADTELKIKMLELEGNAVSMSTAEYERRRSELEHQMQVQQATRNMTAEGRAEYERVADAAFRASRGLAELQTEQSKTFQFGAQSAIKKYREDIDNVAKSTENAISNAFRGMEDALVKFVMTGKLDFRSLATSIISDMVRIAIQMAVMRPLMGMFGGVFGGSSGVNYSIPAPAGGLTGGGTGLGLKFDGGGYTGSGSRSGGLDGKGGFMAMLHPQETVVDHYRGQSLGGGMTNAVTVNVNVESGSEQVKSNQGAGELGKAISAAVKAELINQKRPGGLLAA